MAGIYIHIPFCKQACHYCNFHFSTSMKLREKMAGAILKEIELKNGLFKDIRTDTIYFGGGSPSLLSTQELEAILQGLYKNFRISDNVEITLEANPDDLSKAYLRQLKDLGINRLSIGIQSFDDSLLKYMNRAHNRSEAVRSLEDAAALGFEEVNIDLIYGIPGLADDQWLNELKFALQFPINHISAYSLTVETGTALDHFISKKNWPAPNDDSAANQFLQGSAFLEDNGYCHYEISNFSKGDNYSKHNTAYWQGKPYLGIGPSAHSFLEGRRSWNIANNPKYLRSLEQGIVPSETEILTPADLFNEYIMTGLRTKWGIDLNFIATEFGAEHKEQIQQTFTTMDSNQYFGQGQSIILTKEGWLYSDRICAELFV